MAKQGSGNRQERRAARDKSVLDHLTAGPNKPDLNDRKGERRQFDEKAGRKLDKAIHEEWTPKKGGLPEF